MMVQPPQAHNHRKYDNNGKSLYFRFDDDDTMSYNYIIEITYTWIGHINKFT